MLWLKEHIRQWEVISPVDKDMVRFTEITLLVTHLNMVS
jgi:hypothetical protein